MDLSLRPHLLVLLALAVHLVSGPYFVPTVTSRRAQLSGTAVQTPQPTRPFRIGILAHELTNNMKESLYQLLGDPATRSHLAAMFHSASQISSNYLKFIAFGQIEFFPILISDPLPLLIRQMRFLDGLLLPGGAPGFQFLESDPRNRAKVHVRLNLKRRYFRKADQLIESAKYINRHIRPFAVFGICLGFEMLLLNESRFRVPLEHVDNHNVNEVFTLLPGPSKFRTWVQTAHPDYAQTFANGPQFFYNSKGVSAAAFWGNRRLSRGYHALSYFTSGGRQFVAAVEHRTFPFFGLQFHPEKNLFDFSDYFQADHSAGSVKASRIFQDYFQHLLGRPDPGVWFDPSAFPSHPVTLLPELGYYRDLWVYTRNTALQKLLLSVPERSKGFLGSN